MDFFEDDDNRTVALVALGLCCFFILFYFIYKLFWKKFL